MRDLTIGFQSTHPCGVRLTRWCHPLQARRSFNPRTPAGCDSITTSSAKPSAMFQSTHPCGVRLVTIFITFGSTSFNPRTPAGCDL